MKKIIKWILLALGSFILVVVLNLVWVNRNFVKVSEGPPAYEGPGEIRTALLVIDIQGGTTGATSYIDGYVEQAEVLIARTNELSRLAGDKGWIPVYVRTEVVNPLLNLINNSMARGTEGAELDPRLELTSEHVIVKRKNDSFRDTNLDELLHELEVGKVVIVGLDADGCVDATLNAALNRGYEVSIIPEAIISGNPDVADEKINEFRGMGIKALSMEELR